MKTILTISFLTLFIIGCDNAPQPLTNTNVSTAQSNTGAPMPKSDNSMVVSSHSSEAEKTAPVTPPQSNSGSSAKGSSPMQKAVDVNQMTAEIESADKSYKQNPTDEKAKNKLAEAYFTRAFALTGAAQYRAALGDFRKGLKLKPDNTEAKEMHDQIIEIFQSMQREPPKEGEEPAPLPIGK